MIIWVIIFHWVYPWSSMLIWSILPNQTQIHLWPAFWVTLTAKEVWTHLLYILPIDSDHVLCFKLVATRYTDMPTAKGL